MGDAYSHARRDELETLEWAKKQWPGLTVRQAFDKNVEICERIRETQAKIDALCAEQRVFRRENDGIAALLTDARKRAERAASALWQKLRPHPISYVGLWYEDSDYALKVVVSGPMDGQLIPETFEGWRVLVQFPVPST